MIPSVVAHQVRETVLDYLRTTFALADSDFERALFDFLDGKEGLFKGPYVDIRLPFQKADRGERVPLDIRPDFEIHKHQLKAFQRLYSKDGHQPQHTLVTTGTGSGKTECFLYPVLDHCWRERERPGIKAILLYPMNALASDQARRLAQVLWDDERLRGKVRAGLFVGGKGTHGTADREHLVDKRDVLRDSPPDILLTNYKMLDFLLLRPEDRRLWQHNGVDTLRYLVLDELHTYDGAQGSDVACLIRRLKSRLGCAPGSVCAVGTSATIGGTARSDTIRALTDFAGKVFDEDFFEDSVISEFRCSADETLGNVVDLFRLPEPKRVPDLDPRRHADSGAWLRRQAELWLGEGAGELDRIELGHRLERHDFLRQVLKVLNGTLRSWAELDEGLHPRVPEWEAFNPEERQRLLESFLGLVSHARRAAPTPGDAHRVEPLLTVQAQLWLRELHHLVQKVLPASHPPRFAWADDGVREHSSEEGHWLPIAHCRECGSSGLATVQRESEQVLQTDLQAIGRSWINRARSCRYVAYGHAKNPDPDLEREYLCPGCLRVQSKDACDRCRDPGQVGESIKPLPTIPVRLESGSSDQQPPRFLATCPDCGSDRSLSTLGSRAPSLLSVAISHLYQSDYNEDKKLLAFTDSVQDASHRAGFFGARTYRFNLRTAMQSVVEASDKLPLSDLGAQILAYWGERIERVKLIPTLLPADLRELDTYQRFVERGGAGPQQELEEQLLRRLSWEAVMEFGLNARVGRTLESTLCSTVEIELDAIRSTAEILKLEIDETRLLETAPASGFSLEEIEHFLAGLLNRIRLRGGIDHPLLHGYIREGGPWFLLTKGKQPLMSPFRSESVLPRFLTDRPRQPGTEPVFDSFISQGNRLTWYRDWASRSLGIDRRDGGMNELYREAVGRLEGAGLLVRHGLKKGSGYAWALNPDRLRVTANPAQVTCPECRRRLTLSEAEVERWVGRACTQYRCPGRLERGVGGEQTYYGRIYRSGRLERIFSYEHTGLLTREERETIEEDFKSGTKPGAPNLFVCTPTLELGIDIGDLSAAMLCSVPPATANYLQRVGRTGRKTGNAFCLTVANSRPHDLYFHAQPLEMMAGQVLPPGCFLDAPDMLKRQLVAFAMDAWARQEEEVTRIPNQAGYVLSESGRRTFPGRFIEFYREHRERLADSFLDRFDDYLSPDNRVRLLEFAQGEVVPNLLNNAFDNIQIEINDLRSQQDRARRRLQEIENDPESVEDPELEKRQLEDTRRLLARLIAEIRRKYPLNVLTDEGVLPNYAFPEPGVRLESVVTHPGEKGKTEFEAREYVRPASSAIRELAPFNTFYASGRRVRIDEIDIGTRTQPLVEMWRLCGECSFMRRELSDQSIETACPRCSDGGWSDSGQARLLIHFRRSRSLATRLEASTVDDTDDREEAYYEVLDLIDVAPEHYNGAKLIEDLPFGYELLKNLTLREINFGEDTRTPGTGFRASGTTIGDKGFDVCQDCGRVRRMREIHHHFSCPGHKSATKERIASLFLYREVESEAIRILLPVAEVGLDRKRASFRAALQLGFRRHFQGDPGHLIIRSVREPIPGGYGTRQYLVVFDGVPGGTGYLSELWHGEHFLDVLDKALAALQTCSCQQEPGRDGCYRCLFAYQSQRELPLVSSRLAQEILREILEKRETLKSIHTLSEVSLESKLESELEAKFLLALQARAKKTKGLSWEEKVQGGELRWILRTTELAWEIRAQVELGPAEGVPVACRPDFLISPANADPAIRPVAVFCDGLAYHACPGKAEGRIGDDIYKRQAILEPGRYQVWSVTWKDVGDFEQGAGNSSITSLFAGLNHSSLGKVARQMGLRLDRATGELGSMEMLLAYMCKPDVSEWTKLARVYTFVWLSSAPSWIAGEAGATLETRLLSDVEFFLPGPMPQVSDDAPVLTRYESRGRFAALGRSERDAMRRGEVKRFILRLFDDKQSREEPTFEAAWRSFLQAWNLLQFQDDVDAVSSELIQLSSYRPQVEHALVSADRESEELEVDPALEELLQLATERSRPLIRAIAAAGLPQPVQDYELPTASKVCGPEPELSWPDQKIAILSERQAMDRAAFDRAGWIVLAQPVDPNEVLSVVRARSAAEESE